MSNSLMRSLAKLRARLPRTIPAPLEFGIAVTFTDRILPYEHVDDQPFGVTILWYPTDAALDDFDGGQPGNGDFAESDLARLRRGEARDDIEENILTVTRHANHADDLVPMNDQIDIIQLQLARF